MEQRLPYTRLWEELAAEKSMVFLAGPRQSGKTTLGQRLAAGFPNHLYFCWDILPHRESFLANPLFFTEVERHDGSSPLIVLDEIHKYPDWKNYLKGIYDQFAGEYSFLVSGSGRLDVFQKGGDSLAGRYLLFHLWPFTLAELSGREADVESFLSDPLRIEVPDSADLREAWCGLEDRSGFPEPYLSGRKRSYRRWSNTYASRLIREDIRDLAGIQSVIQLENLHLLLPSKVGSPLSVPSLARDLGVAYNTVRSWLDALEAFFLTFRIGPWTGKIARSILKERKLYLWDSPRITDPGARFENMIALELWRAVNSWTELGYGRFSLHFVKNKEGQEVDFLISRDRKPILLVEAKLKDRDPTPALKKFQTTLGVPAVQLTHEGGTFRLIPNGDRRVLVAPAHRWLPQLP